MPNPMNSAVQRVAEASATPATKVLDRAAIAQHQHNNLGVDNTDAQRRPHYGQMDVVKMDMSSPACCSEPSENRRMEHVS